MNRIITCDPQENQILCALEQTEYELLAPHLELVTISRAEVLCEAYDILQHIYFPLTATASLLCCLEDGTTVEVAMVGNEGILGASALMGRNESLTQVIVSKTGQAFRAPIHSLQYMLSSTEDGYSGMLQKLILRYTQTLLAQISQATACNRRHLLEQQLSSWLLSNFDRWCSDNLPMTQESIAYLMGVRRESITEAAKRLQQAGMIDYRRGYIELKSREKLESNACECYDVIKEELIRLASDSQRIIDRPGNKQFD